MLDGKVVLVTGAASGIGLAMTEAFLAAGARVAGSDVAVEGLAHLEGRDDVLTIKADVTSQGDIDRMVEATLERFGRIDVLCNNAGITDRFLGVDECTDDEWNRTLAVNLTGPFLVSRAVLPHMLAAGSGVLIHTASVAGLTGGNGGAAYCVSKHGLVGLSMNIAAMYGSDGISSIALCPGHTQTGQTEAMKARRQDGTLSPRSEATRNRTEAAFLRRADPAELGRLVVSIVESTPVLNGAVIAADSGYMAH